MSKSKLRTEYEARFGVVDGKFRLYDAHGNAIYQEYPDGLWWKLDYDAKDNQIYYESSKGYWTRREYDANGNEIYYEDSVCGVTIDNRQMVEAK